MARRRRSTGSIPAAPAAQRRSRPPEPEGRRLASRRVLLAAVVVVGVLGVIGFTFASSLSARDFSCAEQLTAPPGASATEAFTTRSLGQTHVGVGTKISYSFCPPTSGSHYSASGAGPLRPGFYGPDDKAGPGGWVHNLEHGFVVALYRCTGGTCPSEADLANLHEFAANGPPTQSAAACGYRSKLLVARFDEMSTPFALLAWGRALLLGAFDATVAGQFAARSIDATAPEPNAC